ncbi:deoxyguanosinetriphosphate triphosphohydrolase [Terrarubrum flagellatum]|uniref:deoxyguanosinetriphosphate triphosphohydrolase n=1 Tax=Terrirubrum flagellatum TaxID=2895980 RepID=UPI003144D54D
MKPAPGQRWRAPYATDPATSRGRLIPEPPSATRTPFQRDRDRIIHSTAFRRLAHKTQVFVHHEGDHYRTRLTHTIEVAQIARALARTLGLDEDLAETIALAHDLGHTPFGHTGEDVLHARMSAFGGFDHNAQALRIVTRLEARYADFDGLNLTWEALEGLVKHNGPLLTASGSPTPRYAKDGVPLAVLEYDEKQALGLTQFAGLEAQVAALADDVAYNAHDIDDGLRAGLFDVGDLRVVPFLARLLDEIEAWRPGLERTRVIHELVRRVITLMVEDLGSQTARNVEASVPRTADDIRTAEGPVAAFSTDMAEAEKAVKNFLYATMYRHPEVMRIRRDADRVVADLFDRFTQDPTLMPGEWRQGLEGASEARIARRACDYIAGMTDRYALIEHRRLFDDTPELR